MALAAKEWTHLFRSLGLLLGLHSEKVQLCWEIYQILFGAQGLTSTTNGPCFSTMMICKSFFASSKMILQKREGKSICLASELAKIVVYVGRWLQSNLR